MLNNFTSESCCWCFFMESSLLQLVWQLRSQEVVFFTLESLLAQKALPCPKKSASITQCLPPPSSTRECHHTAFHLPKPLRGQVRSGPPAVHPNLGAQVQHRFQHFHSVAIGIRLPPLRFALATATRPRLRHQGGPETALRHSRSNRCPIVG